MTDHLYKATLTPSGLKTLDQTVQFLFAANTHNEAKELAPKIVARHLKYRGLEVTWVEHFTQISSLTEYGNIVEI